MVIKLFKNLADYRWLFAFGLMVMMFVPFNFPIHSTFPAVSLLKNFEIPGDPSFFQTKPGSMALVLLFIIFASFFHQMLISNKLLTARNFTGLFYTVAIMALWYPVWPSLYDMLTAGFLFLGIFNMFASEDSKQPLLRAFDASFLISISCILNIYLLPFMLLPFFALFFFRQFTWRLWASSFTGLILPHLFLMSAYFLVFGKTCYALMVEEIFGNAVISADKFTGFPIYWAICTPIIGIAVFRTMSTLGDKKIIVRKKTVLMTWIILFSMILLLFKDVSISLLLMIVSFPSGFFMASSMRRLQEKRLMIFITDVAFLSIVFFHIFLI